MSASLLLEKILFKEEFAYIFSGVTGFEGGKKRITLMNSTQTMAIMLIGVPHLPRVKGPSMNFTRFLYI